MLPILAGCLGPYETRALDSTGAKLRPGSEAAWRSPRPTLALLEARCGFRGRLPPRWVTLGRLLDGPGFSPWRWPSCRLPPWRAC